MTALHCPNPKCDYTTKSRHYRLFTSQGIILVDKDKCPICQTELKKR